MGWGYICDQLRSLKQEQARLLCAFEQSQIQRPDGFKSDHLDVHQTGKVHAVVPNGGILSSAAPDPIVEVHSEPRRPTFGQYADQGNTSLIGAQKCIAEMARTLGDERMNREQGDTALATAQDVLRLELESVRADGENFSCRLGEMAEVCSVNNELQSALKAEARELRHQLSDTRMALKNELRDCTVIDTSVRSTLGELQQSIRKEITERQEECEHILGHVSEFRTSMDGFQIKWKGEAVSEMLEDFWKRCDEALKTEQAERKSQCAEIIESVTQLGRLLAGERAQRHGSSLDISTNFSEFREFVDGELSDVRQNFLKHESLCDNLMSEVIGTGEDLRNTVNEMQKQTQGFTDLKQMFDHAIHTSCNAVRSECIELNAKSVQVFGMELRQECQARTLALGQLRDECKEAMQREIRVRMERDVGLQDALEQEARIRAEAVESLGLSLATTQQHLHTHTHELHVGGLSASAGSSLASLRPP